MSDLGRAEGKAPISLKQTEFSSKQFATRMGQHNFSEFNKWKKVRVAGYHEKKHRLIIWGQNRLKQLRHGPLHRETVVADFLETFETWLPLENFDNAEWIRRQWVEMFLKKCASEVRKGMKKGWGGKKRPVTDFGERAGKTARGNLPELPNTTFMVVIRRLSNGNNDQTSSMQLQASYSDVRHSEELIDFLENPCRAIEPYCLTRYTNATWLRKNWTKSIWHYTHRCKCWMTLYLVRFHTTVPFLTPSSWNWDTMYNYFW